MVLVRGLTWMTCPWRNMWGRRENEREGRAVERLMSVHRNGTVLLDVYLTFWRAQVLSKTEILVAKFELPSSKCRVIQDDWTMAPFSPPVLVNLSSMAQSVGSSKQAGAWVFAYLEPSWHFFCCVAAITSAELPCVELRAPERNRINICY